MDESEGDGSVRLGLGFCRVYVHGDIQVAYVIGRMN